MYKNKLLTIKILDYIKISNKKLFFLSSDSADHAKTPYGKSKRECENILSVIENFWFIRPGPIYQNENNIFKGILDKIINVNKLIIPLPKKGNFNIKLLSIEELAIIIEKILLGNFEKGLIKIKPVMLSKFLTKKNKKLKLILFPKFFFYLIRLLPNFIKNRLPMDLLYNAYSN